MSTFKKSLSIILAALLLLSVFAIAPITASAETVSGTVGDCEYTYDSSTQTLTVTGGTTIDRDTDNKYPWSSNTVTIYEKVQNLVIGEGIKSIGIGAFYYFQKLSSVTLPSTLETIGMNAFGECISLTSIDLPSKLTTIDKLAFTKCSNLKSVTIPKSVTRIDDNAFSNCIRLEELNFKEGINATIGSYAFLDTALKEVYIPKGITGFGADPIGFTSSYKLVDGFRIYAYEGSAADTYAAKKGIDITYITVISEVPVTDVVEPVIGESPVFTFSAFTDGTIEWWRESGGSLKSSGKFKAGEAYFAEITITAPKGSKFAVDDNRKSTVTATVNGEKAAVTTDYNPEDEIKIYYTFPKLLDENNPVEISNVPILNLTKPVAAKTPTYTVNSIEGVNARVSAWCNLTDNRNMEETDTFEYGKEYIAEICLEAEYGYVFKTDGSTTAVKGSINGEEADVVLGHDLSPAKYLYIIKTYTATEGVLTGIDVTDVIEPVAGEIPSVNLSAPASVSVYKKGWYVNNERWINENEVFEYGNTYEFYVYLDAAEGYSFADDFKATINGKDATTLKLLGEDMSKKLAICVGYTLTEPAEPTTAPDATQPDTSETVETQPDTSETVETQPDTSETVETQPDTSETVETQPGTQPTTEPGETTATNPTTEPTQPETNEPTQPVTQPSTVTPTEPSSAVEPTEAVQPATSAPKATAKKANTIKVKAKTVKAKAAKKTVIKKSAAFKITKAVGKLSFKKVKGDKKITISTAGKITVKKGLKKGKTYKFRVKVTAKGNSKYKKGSKTVTVKIKIK